MPTEKVRLFKQLKDFFHFKSDGMRMLCAAMGGGRLRGGKYKVKEKPQMYPLPKKAGPAEPQDDEKLKIGKEMMGRYKRRFKMEADLKKERVAEK
jgi:hypothetical protein